VAEARVDVGQDVIGQVVIGDHNLTVQADHSVVTVLAPEHRPVPRRRETVRLLPRRVPEPIGRAGEMAALREAVEAGRPVQLSGPAGSGRSTLLRYACRELADDDTVFLYGNGGDVPDLLQGVFEACYTAEGYQPSPVELRHLMTDVPVRLFVDDLDVTDEERDALLDTVPAGTVVFTCLDRAVLDGTTLSLKGLDAESGLALLERSLGRPLRDDERDTGRALWQAAGGSPLLLVRAAAAADEGLPRPTEIAELLPRLLDGLSDEARQMLAILGMAGTADVSAALLARLMSEPDAEPDIPAAAAAVDELASRGMVIGSGRGYRLAPGADAVLSPPEPADVERTATRLRAWVAAARHSPQDVADHAGLITAMIDATVAAGRADLGARLAKAAAPIVACSLRMGAWERILRYGTVAARRAGDRSILAYLTHENGVRELVTGKAAVAAGLIGAAVALWYELGDTGHLAAAHHTQALAHSAAGTAHASAAHATAAAAHTAAGHNAAAHTAAAGHTAAGHTATHGTVAGAKAGLGLKLAIVGAAAATSVGGGYAIVHATTPRHVVTAPRPSPPAQLTGVQLASALLPSAGGMKVLPSTRVDSGAALATAAPKYDLATMTCTDPTTHKMPLFPDGTDVRGFVRGFGETAFAGEAQSTPGPGGSLSSVNEQTVIGAFDQAIYQFATPAKAQTFFAAVRQIMAGCSNAYKNETIGARVDAAPVQGHQAIIANRIVLLRPTPAAGNVDFDSTMAPYFVLDGVYVYALAPTQGRNAVTGEDGIGNAVRDLPAKAGELIANVAALTSRRPVTPSPRTS
jgi:hypothetical protein